MSFILPDPRDAIHKAWLYRTLSAIADDEELSRFLRFKGGTCAAMRGFLDRFSIDLDYDFVGEQANIPKTREHLEKIFISLDLSIKDKSKVIPQYFLRYPAPPDRRNTLKIEATVGVPTANEYEAVRFSEIDRIIYCETIETMFANKMVAPLDRWERNRSIAGRDIYDIHHFFLQGYSYRKAVIFERRRITNITIFLEELLVFVSNTITQTIIDQDLNTLLTPKAFLLARKYLKQETVMFLREEVARQT